MGDLNKSGSFDDCPIERTHGGAATPQQVLEESHVALRNAESLKFETTSASHASSRPSRSASIVVVFDCSKGGAQK
jgi:hypothetical protein